MLRIEPKRIEAKQPRGAGRTRSAGTDFTALVAERRPIRTAATRHAAPIEGLLALQAGEEGFSPAVRRRAARGMAVLDTLDTLRMDTLAGRSPTETLDALAGQLRALGPATTNRGLERTMAALELRAQVELAKREMGQRRASSGD